MDKSIAVVRYLPGTSGKFLSAVLIRSLFDKNIKLIQSHRAHKNNDESKYSNFIDLRFNENHRKITEAGLTVNEDYKKVTAWWKENLKFTDTPFPCYTINTHALHIIPILDAFPTAKLINIVYDGVNDLDQIIYNFVYKWMFDIPSESLSWINSEIEFIKTQIPDIDLSNIDTKKINHNQLREYACIFKLSYKLSQHSNTFNQISRFVTAPHININCRSIWDGSVINQIDEIADFIGVSISSECRENAVRLAAEYASAQTIVPWPLDLIK